MRVVSLVLMLSSVTAWAVPQQMTYEGYLTDLGDQAFSGSVTVTFSLYPAEDSDQAVWSETQNCLPR